MRQLSGLDVSFLTMETGRQFGHVSGLSIYGRPDDPDFDPYLAFRTQLEDRLPVLEPFRRRLVEVPFGLDRPYWVNDPDFDLDFHLRHIAVPGDGDEHQVGELVGRLIGRQMDRTRPLWEAYVIDGLPDGDFAILTKVHHATIDGAAGAEMLSMILDPTPPEDDPWRPERVPGNAELMARTAVEVARTPAKALRLQVRALSELGRVTQTRGFTEAANQIRRGIPGPAGNAVRRLLGDVQPNEADRPPLLPNMVGPKTPFNASVTPHRRFAYRSTSLSHIKQIKNACGATVNDVVMAVCAGALRRYLEDHDALPDRDLIAMVPVSIRTGEEEDRWSNRVSAIFANLPTATENPLERIKHAHEAMVEGKGQFDLMPADMLIDISELAPPALSTRAARIAARTRVADWTNPPANLVVSNVPGPRSVLTLGGKAPLKHYYPVSTIVDGQGLNITVHSYADELDFGLVACRELVPDLWTLADYCVEELTVLADALGIVLTDEG
ncbi:MAG: wax ester/triacylglycerol synthase family O-acyltransferase [Actinomycetota bacterium]